MQPIAQTWLLKDTDVVRLQNWPEYFESKQGDESMYKTTGLSQKFSLNYVEYFVVITSTKWEDKEFMLIQNQLRMQFPLYLCLTGQF